MTEVLVVDDSPLDRKLVEQLLLSHQPGDTKVRFAENGIAAQRRIRDCKPDVVITDLMMPEMDGLKLVESLADEFSDIPVILMTSRGTDEIAVAALKSGAASFVPKTRLSDRLNSTVQQVIALKRGAHPYAGLLNCLSRLSARFRIKSDLTQVQQLVGLVRTVLASMPDCHATEAIRVSLALEEGLLNALVHGSLELTDHVRQKGFASNADYFKTRCQQSPYCERMIDAELDVDSHGVKFVVRDEGPGFDANELSSVDGYGPFESGFGRGLTLMRSFMHQVRFNGSGNELTLRKSFE